MGEGAKVTPRKKRGQSKCTQEDCSSDLNRKPHNDEAHVLTARPPCHMSVRLTLRHRSVDVKGCQRPPAGVKKDVCLPQDFLVLLLVRVLVIGDDARLEVIIAALASSRLVLGVALSVPPDVVKSLLYNCLAVLRL